MHEFKLPDMSCGHCRAAVTEAVQTLDAQAQVAVDLTQRTVRIDSTADRQALVNALTEAGYPPA